MYLFIHLFWVQKRNRVGGHQMADNPIKVDGGAHAGDHSPLFHRYPQISNPLSPLHWDPPETHLFSSLLPLSLSLTWFSIPTQDDSRDFYFSPLFFFL